MIPKVGLIIKNTCCRIDRKNKNNQLFGRGLSSHWLPLCPVCLAGQPTMPQRVLRRSSCCPQYEAGPVWLAWPHWKCVFVLRVPEYHSLWGSCEVPGKVKSRIVRWKTKSRTYHCPKNAWIRSRIFLYMVFVWLYMEVICPNTVKYGIVFRRFASFLQFCQVGNYKNLQTTQTVW